MAELSEVDKVHELLKTALDRRVHRKIDFFVAYPKQSQFFAAGEKMRERLLIAGNQLGKTEAGAVETDYHLTGKYPDDWKGRRFDHPVRAWAAGESSTVVRDVQQNKLCGKPGVENSLGTGYIPKEDFADKPSMARGVTDAYDTIQVKHYKRVGSAWVCDGTSTLTFKSYEQGRTKFQGEPVDFIWLDEEAPMDIYSECLTRVTATGGMVFTTFTPLKGRTEVVERFLTEKSDDRTAVTMTIYDVTHVKDREKVIQGYPAHEREARAMGVPVLGSGRIFPYVDDMISEPPLEYLPQHWAKLWGIDFGIGHPFGAALIVYDRDNDIIHLHHAFRMKDGRPMDHAAAMKPIGAAVPVAWPHDGENREKASGEALITSYRKEGLLTLDDHSTWEAGGYSTEMAVLELQTRATTGKFKVARQLMEGDFGEEWRFYHRKDGLIVKERDDILSALFKCLMMKRYARTVNLGNKVGQRRQEFADGLDFDIFAA